GEDVVAQVDVRVDVLHVVEVLERVDEAHEATRVLDSHRHLDRGDERGLGGLVVEARVDDRGADGDQVGRLGDDLPLLARVLDLLRARLEGRLEDRVLVRRLLHDRDDALAIEVVGDGAGVAHRPVVAGHGDAHVRGRAVAVVRQALDEHRDAAGAVALVHDRLVVDAAAVQATAALDRAVDVVIGDGRLLRALHRVVQCGVALEVRASVASRDLDVLDELREQLAALRIDRGLLVLGRRPLGVACHVHSSVSVESRVTRHSTGGAGASWPRTADIRWITGMTHRRLRTPSATVRTTTGTPRPTTPVTTRVTSSRSARSAMPPAAVTPRASPRART